MNMREEFEEYIGNNPFWLEQKEGKYTSDITISYWDIWQRAWKKRGEHDAKLCEDFYGDSYSREEKRACDLVAAHIRSEKT